MIQTEEQTIEQPGKNAIQHACEMKVEIPGDDDESSSFKKCLLIALLQCTECAAWLCGTECLEHAQICVRCDGTFCPEHYQAHRLANECHGVAA